MSLEAEIESVRSQIKTDNYPMSIGEWINLYQNKEIEIHPVFQRFFRWTTPQKSRLIESILLGIPIPSIFVAQRKDGVWDVVDGLQRLSTIYEFVGILKDADGKLKPPFVLDGTKYLPSLRGAKWDDASDPINSLKTTQRLDFKRSKIGVSIILKDSAENGKFELFQRLNAGGTPLTPQEVRSCLLVMTNPAMFDWLKLLASNEDFLDCISISGRQLDEQYNLELALRFVLLRAIDPALLTGLNDFGEFISDHMATVASANSLDLVKEKMIFDNTFSRLSTELGSECFRRYDINKGRFLGGFLISAFESVALGLGNRDASSRIPQGEITQRIKSMWGDQNFISVCGAGISASSRVPKLIPLGRALFSA